MESNGFDVEEIKRKKLAEMKEKFTEQQATEQQELQQEAEMDAIMRRILEPEAKSRLANIRLVNKKLYFKAIQAVLYLAQQGRLDGKVNDYQMKRILERLSGAKREIRIVRKGKVLQK